MSVVVGGGGGGGNGNKGDSQCTKLLPHNPLGSRHTISAAVRCSHGLINQRCDYYPPLLLRAKQSHAISKISTSRFLLHAKKGGVVVCFAKLFAEF